MNDLRAIETTCLGHRFRSRLEARWAIVFECLGIAWNYEREAFRLPGGTGYLPDFYLPEMRLWVEVKPSGGDASKLARFAKALVGTGERATVLREIPGESFGVGYWDEGGEPGAACWVGQVGEPAVLRDEPYLFCVCERCGGVGFTYQGRPRRIGCCAIEGNDKAGRGGRDEIVMAAFAVARKWRFEPESHDPHLTFRHIGDLIPRRLR